MPTTLMITMIKIDALSLSNGKIMQSALISIRILQEEFVRGRERKYIEWGKSPYVPLHGETPQGYSVYSSPRTCPLLQPKNYSPEISTNFNL
jgi:hypothetical protein